MFTANELLEVAEVVAILTARYREQADRYEKQQVEHRAAFGARTEADAKIIAKLQSEIGAAQMAVLERDSLMSERDGLLTQVQDMRAEIERLRIEAAKCKAARDDLYQREGIEQKRRMDVEDERDALRAEVEFLKTLRPKPDLTQLHAKGKEAWSDVPNATQWVEEMRGNSEATHDTEAGKAVAESAVKTEPVTEEIKVGDLGEVFQATTRTLNSDVGITGCVSSIHPCHGGFLVKFDPSTQSRRSAGMQAFGLCDVRKVTT